MSISDDYFSNQSIKSYSDQIIGPALLILVRTNSLAQWCGYVIDSMIQAKYSWQQPELRQLFWWRQSASIQEFDQWINRLDSSQLNWQLSIASGYYSAASSWFYSDLEDRYIANRHAYEVAHCRVISCGSSHGLALDLSLALEANPGQEEQIVQSLGDQLSISTEVVSLEDISSGIPQLLAGSPPGEWLPPFHNGANWILLQVTRHERPTLQELAPRLLLEAMRAWRQQRCQELAAHWLQVYSASQAAADA